MPRPAGAPRSRTFVWRNASQDCQGRSRVASESIESETVPPRVWGFWKTLAWGIPLTLTAVVFQTLGALGYLRLWRYLRPQEPISLASAVSNGAVLAASLALSQHSKLYLLHVEEGVTSQMYGRMASTVEVEAGLQYFNQIEDTLRQEGVDVELVVVHSRNPNREIVRYARSLSPDLIVMGAHGHKGLKDLIFGTTINAVRHDLDVPILVVREQGQ